MDKIDLQKINAHFENCLSQLESANYEIGFRDAHHKEIPPRPEKEREIFRRYVREAFYLYFNERDRPIFVSESSEHLLNDPSDCR